MALLGRFAPTPSGRMHLGNVFTALMAWLGARSAGGGFLLRIEDLDTARCSLEQAELLREDLLWLGLDWDAEQPCQSGRSAYYEEVLDRLSQRGTVFPCWCTRGDLKNAPNAPPRLRRAPYLPRHLPGSDPRPASRALCRETAPVAAAGTGGADRLHRRGLRAL